jgi:hypothetical protein
MDGNFLVLDRADRVRRFLLRPDAFMRRGHSKDPDHKNAADETQNKLSSEK